MKIVLWIALIVAGRASMALETGTYVKRDGKGGEQTLKVSSYAFPLNLIMSAEANLTRVEQVGGDFQLVEGGRKVKIVAAPTYCRLTYYGALTYDRYLRDLDVYDVGLKVDSVGLQPGRWTDSAEEFENCHVFVSYLNDIYLKEMDYHLYMTVGGKSGDLQTLK